MSAILVYIGKEKVYFSKLHHKYENIYIYIYRRININDKLLHLPTVSGLKSKQFSILFNNPAFHVKPTTYIMVTIPINYYIIV